MKWAARVVDAAIKLAFHITRTPHVPDAALRERQRGRVRCYRGRSKQATVPFLSPAAVERRFTDADRFVFHSGQQGWSARHRVTSYAYSSGSPALDLGDGVWDGPRVLAAIGKQKRVIDRRKLT